MTVHRKLAEIEADLRSLPPDQDDQDELLEVTAALREALDLGPHDARRDEMRREGGIE